MVQIKTEEELIGKEITGIMHLEYDGLMAIFFDHEYAIFEVELGWDRGEETICFTGGTPDDHHLRGLGIITEDEYAARRMIKKAETRAAEREYRLKRYQELKKEFEDE